MATNPVAVPDLTPDGEAMSNDELASLLKSHESMAVGYYADEIADEQALSLDAYYGRPYGDEQPGRSQVVDRTVAITTDNAVAALMRPFVSADEAVEFQPRKAEDEEQAKQATEYVNYVFQVDNDGFLLLHNWFKAALIEKLGIVKVWWEDSESKTVQRMEGLDGQQVEMLKAQQGDEYKITGGPWKDPEDNPETQGLFALEITKTLKDGRIRIVTVPSEEFLISPFARDLKSAEYLAHKPTDITRSDLIDMGLDREVVDGLPAAKSDVTFSSRSTARYQDENGIGSRSALGYGNDKSRDLIDVRDEYPLVDFNGDGIAERRRIIRCNNEILFNEEVDDSPFATLCPVPMPHKVYGLCPADQVRDVQRIATVVSRQMLDNLYLANNAKTEVPEGAATSDGSTYDDLMDPTPGGIVRTRAPGMLNPLVVPFVADKSFPMLEYFQNEQEACTGIKRTGQGIDTDTLKKSGQMTATEVNEIVSGQNMRVEVIARIFAETGVKRLFKLMLKLLIDHQPRERMIRLRGKWVEIDPRSWNAEMDLSVTVGLGVGTKAEQDAKATGLLQTLEALAATPYGQMVTPENAYNAVKKKIIALGFKDVENYITDPATIQQQPQQPPPPDPKMLEAQAKAQVAQQQLQIEQQKAGGQLQISAQESQFKTQLQAEQAAAQAQIAEQQLHAQTGLREQEIQLNHAHALHTANLSHELDKHKASLAAQVQMESNKAKIAATPANEGISKDRPGGALNK
jgi:hypothetical protein